MTELQMPPVEPDPRSGTVPVPMPVAAPTPEIDPAAEPLSAEGSSLLYRGYALDAVEVLRHAVATGEPSAPDLLSRAYLDSGSWAAAVEWLTPMVTDGHVEFARRLGVACLELGDREAAEHWLRVAIDSGDVAASNDLAILLRLGDRTGEALLVLGQAVLAGDPTARANLVELHLENGDLPSAVVAAESHFDRALPDTVLALADVRAAESRLEEADAFYREACELGAVRAHTSYGHFLLARGDRQGAEFEYREAERHGEQGWAFTIGRFLVDEGRFDEARDFLQIAVDTGDQEAADLLIEINGNDPNDD